MEFNSISFRRKAKKSREFWRNTLALLLHNTVVFQVSVGLTSWTIQDQLLNPAGEKNLIDTELVVSVGVDQLELPTDTKKSYLEPCFALE